VGAESFLKAEAHARKIWFSVVIEDGTEGVPEKFQSRGVGNDEDVTGRVRRAARIPRKESDPRGENREVKDLGKFFPENLRKATGNKKVELILEVIVTEWTNSARSGETTNTSTERKRI